VRTSIWPFIGPFADDASFARCLRSNRGTGTGRGARPRWHGKRLSGRASVQIVEGEGDDPGIEWIGLQSGSSLRRTWLSPGNGSSGHSPAAYPHIAVRRLRRHRENRSGHTPSGSRMGLARIRRRVPPGRTGCVGVSSGMHVNRRLQCSIGGTGSSPHCERWGLGLACSSLPERVGWGSGWARRDSRRTAQSSERSPAAAWFPTRSRSSRDSEGRCWSPPHTHNKA
jgi:hypothetical protein